MLEQLIAIFRNTFVESIRQPIYLILIGIGLIALVLNLNLSAFTMDDDNKFLIDMGMATIFLVGLLIAAFVATSVLTQEIENRTVLTVVSKPVGRPVFILGKYLGVSSAVLVAVIILACAFFLTVRHEVQQTAKDEIDMPVAVFGMAGLILSVGIGLIGNYLHGWVFTSTTLGALLPTSIICYLAVMAVSKEWAFQLFTEDSVMGFSPDFRPKYWIAAAGLGLALLVLCAVAIAASTRLGQVMTIFACIMVFLAGLLSDYAFGRHSYEAPLVARITYVSEGRDIDGDFSDEEDWYEIGLDRTFALEELRRELALPQDATVPLFLAADPLGLKMLGAGASEEGISTPPVEIRQVQDHRAQLGRTAETSMPRAPREGDYLLAGPPTTHYAYRVAWGVVPNLQFMVLVDPITQRHPIPLSHLGVVAIYSLLLIIAILSLAVILFQKREVG